MSFFMQLFLQGLALGSVYALVGQGLNLTYLATRVVNFGHGALLMLATYVAIALNASGVTWSLAILLGIAASGVGAVIIYLIGVKPVHNRAGALGWMVATLGAGIVLEAIVEIVFGSSNRAFPSLFFSAADAVSIGSVKLSSQVLMVAAISVVILVTFEMVFRFSRWGMVLQATSFSSDLAQLRGIRVSRVIMASFAISGLMAGLAGTMVAPLTGTSPTFGFSLLLSGFAVIVIGGVGNSLGAMIGGLVVGVSEQLVGGYISTSAQGAVAFIFLIGILMVRPQGILGSKEAVKL